MPFEPDVSRQRYIAENECAFFEVIYDDKSLYYSIPHKGMISFEEWSGLNISSVFIPAGEMLSHSKGFLALNSKYKLPFDYAGEDRIKKRVIDSFEVLDLEGWNKTYPSLPIVVKQ